MIGGARDRPRPNPTNPLGSATAVRHVPGSNASRLNNYIVHKRKETGTVHIVLNQSVLNVTVGLTGYSCVIHVRCYSPMQQQQAVNNNAL